MSSRDQLTSAMADLLWERGYAATSPRDVMARAGVGQGSMYHHFSGKHALAVEVLSAVTGEMAGESSVLEGEGSPLERIKSYLSRPRPGTRGCRVGRMTQDPQVVADPELLAIVADAFDTMLGRWEQAIAAAVTAGELPADTVPAELARTLAAVLQGGYVLARAKGEQGPMDAAVRGAVRLLDAAHAAAVAADADADEPGDSGH
ncbi:TetR/AcrR family transcriptional regulator [Actinopolymorpha sp. NPDC004070]|uniref:TetR/AcrR family transcriptional regulator n=1 Tax=Actinopolymorpha sp. NPDC004070 TaxID=3154548 RepID=UPI0033AAB0DD